jgi:hypothetical protein
MQPIDGNPNHNPVRHMVLSSGVVISWLSFDFVTLQCQKRLLLFFLKNARFPTKIDFSTGLLSQLSQTTLHCESLKKSIILASMSQYSEGPNILVASGRPF